jgi:hypothetical protein
VIRIGLVVVIAIPEVVLIDRDACWWLGPSFPRPRSSCRRRNQPPQPATGGTKIRLRVAAAAVRSIIAAPRRDR